MKKMRIGVLGCANISGRLLITTIKERYEFKLIAVSSREISIEKLKKFSLKFDYEVLLEYGKILSQAELMQKLRRIA